MPAPRTAATADLAARRRRLLALHRRHAGLVRAIFYWFGAELEVLDDAVLRTFVLADHHTGDDPPTRKTLGRLAWRVASSEQTTHTADPDRDPGPVPRLGAGADLLARFLATHTTTLAERGAFVLAELAGLEPSELAVLLGFPFDTMRRHLGALRNLLLTDPEVIALGGPRAVLTASVAPFTDDHAWSTRHATTLAAQLTPSAPGLSDMLRRPSGIITLGAATVALLLLLRPGPPAAQPTLPAPVTIAVPLPPPPVLAPPLPLPAPQVLTPTAAPVRKLARRGKARSGAREALAAREQLAKARDPGAIIVELEMIGAGRKSLPANPRQALAYAEQHARDYPDSQLVNQRAELRVRALCALGRRDEARAEAQRRPQPKVQEALRDACK